MSKCCAIPGCRSRIRSCVMFSIAEHSSLAQWWTTTPWYDEAKGATISRDLRICSVHFQKDHLDASQRDVRLMRNVVPSVNLPGSFVISKVEGNYAEPTPMADCSTLLMIYCRFCGKKQKHPIKNHLEDLVQSEDLLQLCLGRGRFLEGFPNGVCDHCLEVIKLTTNFIEHCGKAQEKLQKIFFGTSQQMVDSMIEEDEDYQEMYQDSRFEMPEAIISLKEESFGGSDNIDEEDNVEYLESGQEDPLIEEQYVEAVDSGGEPSSAKGGSEEQSDIRCTICNRTFNRKRALNAHMESIHEGRTFSCPICGKTMGWRKTLQRHMKSHEENFQKYKCEQCDKMFSRPSHLRLHMNSHDGRKCYCPLCQKGYRDRSKVTTHLEKKHDMDHETAKTYAQQAKTY